MAKTLNSPHSLQHCKCFVVLEGLFECKCTPGTIFFEAAFRKKALMRTTQDNTASRGVTAPGHFFTRLSEISVLLCLSISPIAAAPLKPIPFEVRLRMSAGPHLGSVRAAEKQPQGKYYNLLIGHLLKPPECLVVLKRLCDRSRTFVANLVVIKAMQ
jgi:hypothetical protein